MFVTAVSAFWAWAAAATHIACVVRLRGSKAPFASTWMWMSAGTAALTSCYGAAYTWLVFGSPDRATWSEMLAYVAFVGWPVVFVMPGAMTLYAYTRTRATESGGR